VAVVIRLDTDPSALDRRIANSVQRQQQAAAKELLQPIQGDVVAALLGLAEKLHERGWCLAVV
jgi:hypothetical protein